MIYKMGSENIVCEVCGVVVEKKLYLKHMRHGHKDKRENKCQLCQKEFSSAYNLQYHMAHHINARNFVCQKCPRAYNTAADLAQHQWTHDEKEPFKCDECGDFFPIRSKYNAHLRTHLPETSKGRKKSVVKGPSECPICHVNFVSLADHNRIVHLGLKRFECILCGKAFGRKSGLDRHVLVVHQKIKAFKCEVCNKAFGERSLLERHMKIHTEKYKIAQRMKTHKYKNLSFCSFCKQQLNDVADIKHHFETVHADLKHTCDICFKRFSKQSSLNIHIKVFHKMEKNFFCDFCPNKGFPEKSQLKRHMQRHQTEKNPVKRIVKDESDKVMCEPDQEFVAECFETDESEINFDPFDRNFLEVKLDCDSSPIEKIMLVVKDEILSNDESNEEREPLNEPIKSLNLEEEMNFLDSEIFNENFKEKHKKIPHRTSETKLDRRKRKNKDQPTCPICQKSFAKTQFLKLHVDAIHHNVSYECEICGKKFSFQRAKDRHVRIVHNNERAFKCSHCDKSFGGKTQLRDHVSLTHSSNPDEIMKYYCDTCEKSFSSASALRQHLRGVHQNIKQKRPTHYKCKYCKENLTNKYQKQKHLAQVHLDGVKTSRLCQLCNSEFQLFDDFKKHVESHENFHICLICGVDNSSEEALRQHMEDHKHIKKELRKLICDACGHKVFTKPQLKVHMRKHMRETNFYVCDICGQSYKFFAPFLYHKKLHEGKKDFVCTICGKEFMQKQVFEVHLRTHTQEKPFKCSVCVKTFASKPVLNAHFQTHSSTRKVISCKECNLVFIDRKQSKKHDEEFHPDRRPYHCNICKETFKFEHLRKIHVKHKHKSDILQVSEDNSSDSNEFHYNF